MTVPDDPPFGTTAPTTVPPGSPPAGVAPEPTSDPPTKPEPTPGNGLPEGLTLEQLQAAVSESIKPFQSKIDELTQENRALQERLQQTPTPTPEDTTVEGDFLTQFSTDPEGTTRKAIREELKSSLGELSPLLGAMLDTAQAGILASHQQAIDNEFGAGTWTDEFQPVLEKVLADARKTNPALLSNRQYLDKEVAALKGWKMGTLVERAQKHRTATDERATKERDELVQHLTNTTNLTGGLRGPGAMERKELSEAEKDYIARRQEATGETIDPKVLRRNLSIGNPHTGTTIDEWRAARDAAAKEAK